METPCLNWASVSTSPSEEFVRRVLLLPSRQGTGELKVFEVLDQFDAEIRTDTSIARSIMVSLVGLLSLFPTSEAYVNPLLADNEDRELKLSKARHRFTVA